MTGIVKDLYAELGVPIDADESQIGAAYRRRAKETHPDAPGGTAAAFERTKLALVVLSDPEKRKKYDDTGDATGEAPDNVRVTAINIVERHMAAIVNGFVQNPQAGPAQDPRRRDVVKEIKAGIQREMAQTTRAISAGKELVAFFRDMAARFTSADGDDFLARGFEHQARGNEKSIETLEEAVKASDLALRMLERCRFRRDEPFGLGLYPIIGRTGAMPRV